MIFFMAGNKMKIDKIVEYCDRNMHRKKYVRIATIINNVLEVMGNVWIKCISLETQMNDKIMIVHTWFNIMFADICMRTLLSWETVLALSKMKLWSCSIFICCQ